MKTAGITPQYMSLNALPNDSLRTGDSEYPEFIQQLYREASAYLLKTPLIYSEYLSEEYGGNIYLKLENLQHTGSFKLRGVVSKMLSLLPDDGKRNFITASSGNHGIALAHMAKKLGRTSKVFVPTITPKIKIEKIQSYGGEVVLKGKDWDGACLAAKKEALASGSYFIHPFSDERVIAGQATIAFEIMSALPSTDTIVCSVGGGGMLSGIAKYTKSINQNINVYGVETSGADSMAKSLEKGNIFEMPEMTSIAESIGVKKVAPNTYDYVQKYSDGVVVVKDQEALIGMLEVFREHKMLIEPSCGCCIWALNQIPRSSIENKNVVIVLSGANVDIDIVDAAMMAYVTCAS